MKKILNFLLVPAVALILALTIILIVDLVH